jgi:hypothetical protein
MWCEDTTPLRIGEDLPPSFGFTAAQLSGPPDIESFMRKERGPEIRCARRHKGGTQIRHKPSNVKVQ